MFNKKLKKQILSLQARIMELERELQKEKHTRALAEIDVDDLCRIVDAQSAICVYFSKYIVDAEEAKAKKQPKKRPIKAIKKAKTPIVPKVKRKPGRPKKK